MGGIYKKADQQQHAPEFLAWLADAESALATFFADDAPEIGALSDRWSREGLKVLGTNMRARFGDAPKSRSFADPEVLDRYRRYLGEVYCRTLDAQWRNVPENHPGEAMWPVLMLPFQRLYLDPIDQLNGAFTKTTKRMTVDPDGEMAWAYGKARSEHADWVSAGKPDLEAWQKLELDRLLGRTQGPDV
ncbi:hypothetical protein [Nocardia asiatica]|uniref:hypothetical protein n=1 Tax=Nocardia asiatica TaxID=209252 RepID=UPI0002E15BC5|nr:hypothetical protein [Nocardia asiatica]